ncbi:MAG TPA: class I SAM-dependent methyltransferase [Solirubrobacteraceae bacterium]|jgi:demethylmenaquinone methyltransferase/2-methoxy-6-polyprenyl-1,4-benzoquinol methylase
MSDIESLLGEQAHYYRERAGEYDDWWFRRGRYDHGPEANARWFADVAEVESVVARLAPMGDVLELACGTGLWTRKLVAHARGVTAVDASPEMLEINRARVGDPRVAYVEADLFAWEPDRTYDVCFFSFWLSHVPEERFAAFWEKVERALAPAGRAFFLDSSRHDLASAVDHELPDSDEQTMLRRLADGREFQIVKRFYESADLQRRLAQIGWTATVETTSEFFVYGQVTLTS